jgi:hypothetical protein
MLRLDGALDRLDEELGDLGRPQLLPRKRSLAFLNDEDADAVLQVIYWDLVQMGGGEEREQWSIFLILLAAVIGIASGLEEVTFI